MKVSSRYGRIHWGATLTRTLCLWFEYTHFSGAVQAQTIASWIGPRVALIRDSVFIEGGFLSRGTWSSGTSTWIDVQVDPVSLTGRIYKLDLGLAFNTTDPEGSLSIVNNTHPESDGPSYVYGSMFVDTNGFVLFGGLASKLQEDDVASGVISAQLYPWPHDDSQRKHPIKFLFDPPTLAPPSLSNSSLWHRCCGLSASIPNDHLSFYFGGLISDTSGVLEYNPSEYGRKATNLAEDMIACNTTDLRNIDCTSTTLPDFVIPRAEAALVWLPIGPQGSLIVFGGVETPADIIPDPFASINRFMTDILIYNIATETWHLQPTLGTGTGPPATSAFCTILAASNDRSSFNIYMYGGYDGSYMNENVYDDVWVLSLPSFKWIRVYDGSASVSHGRQNHQCVSPYPNQMMTIGGGGVNRGSLTSQSFIDVFDMNNLVWTSTYDPVEWSDYKVPKNITDVIGGNEDGGAKLPATGLDSAVASLFRTPYEVKIPTYYPYARKTLIQHIRGIPEWLRTIAGVLAYLSLSSAAFSCVMLLWRRRYLKAAGLSGADLGPGHGLIAWSQRLLGRRIKLPTENKVKDKIEPLTIPYFDNVDTVSTRTRVSTDGDSTRTSRWSEQNSLFNDVELRTFISRDRHD